MRSHLVAPITITTSDIVTPINTAFSKRLSIDKSISSPTDPNYGLHSAAATGNIGLVSFALTNGQPTNAVLDGVLPIHAAASGGNTRVVRMLIDAGADLNIGRLSRKLGASGGKGRTGASGSTMNIYTAPGGSHIGTGGSTALHFAAANGHVEVLTLLLRCGADLTKTDKHGVTPLILAERLGRAEAAATLRAWAKEHPKSSSNSNGAKQNLRAKRSLEALLRGPWAGSRVDLNASRVDLSTSGDSRGELGSGSSGIDLGFSSSRTELGELGFYPPPSGGSLNDSRRPSLPTSAGLLFGPKTHRPRSNRTSWSGGKMRRFFSRMKREGSTSWDAGERTAEVDWAEEVEFRRGERVAVEMGLKAPSSALMKRASSQNEAVRPRRKASEFHPDPEYDFLEDALGDPLGSRPVIDDDMDDDMDMDMVPPKRVLHPRSFSSSSAGFSRVGMNRLTSPSMPILPLPNEPSLLPSATASTASIPATSPRHTPVRSHAPSPAGPTHMRSLSGGMITRRGLRGSSSFSSFLPRQPEEVIPSSGDSTVDGTAPVANDRDFQPHHLEPQPLSDPKEASSTLESSDGRFRGDSLSSTDSGDTNQLSSSMATTDTAITIPSLYAANSPLPPHKSTITFSPVFEADDLDEADEHPSENLGDTRRHSITPLNLRSINTFEQAQSLVRQVEREILEPGHMGPDSPSLVEQLAAYGESLAIERRFARGEAQKRAWQAERKSHDEEADNDDEDEEGGWASYVREPAPKIGAPLGRTASVDYHASRFRSMGPPSRTHSMPIRQTPTTPLSSALMAPFSPTSQSRAPERASFTGALPGSQTRQNSGVLTRAAMIPRRTNSSHGSYVSRPSSIEIIETAPTPVDSSSYRAFELHRRSASTGVSGFPWTSYTSYNTTTISQSPEQSDDGDSHYELNSRTAPLSRITTAPSKIGNAIGNAFSRDPDYEPVHRKKLKRFVKQLVNAERSGTEKGVTLI
ncbi:unnamed protein product [Rhizoctonia solani]|uniref:Uncharacterized protein n=1 Tax=Rhizoctonia solani TaxID=456999 RepID=A0A8H3EAS2_9AGAM|nr:unnamed protein product [Rhizoctonia solani]